MKKARKTLKLKIKKKEFPTPLLKGILITKI